MVTGRKPNPTGLKLLKGEKRPSRVNQHEPDPGADNIAPVVKLSPEELEVWNQIVPDLARARMVKNTDSVALTQLCQLEATRRKAHDNYLATGMLARGSQGQPVMSATMRIMLEAQTQVLKLLAEFGMTPSSRSRIVAPPPPEKGKRGFDID